MSQYDNIRKHRHGEKPSLDGMMPYINGYHQNDATRVSGDNRVSQPYEHVRAAAAKQKGMTAEELLRHEAAMAERQRIGSGVIIADSGNETVNRQRRLYGGNPETNAKEQAYAEKSRQEMQNESNKTVQALLDFTSPSYWVNVYGGNLGVAQSLGLDMLVYSALGGLAGLMKNGIVAGTEKGLIKGKNFGLRTEAAKEGLLKQTATARPPWITKGKPSLSNLNVSSSLHNYKDQVSSWYMSDEYMRRCLEAGMTPEQAQARVKQLVYNVQSVPIRLGDIKTHGETGLNFHDPTEPVSITIRWDVLDSPEEAATVIEELLHASEYNGLIHSDLLDVKMDPYFKRSMNEMLDRLGNDFAQAMNKKIQPKEINRQSVRDYAIASSSNPEEALKKWNALPAEKQENILREMEEYYKLDWELRARAIGELLGNPTLSKEFNLFTDTETKANYKAKVLEALGIITTAAEKRKNDNERWVEPYPRNLYSSPYFYEL